MQVHFTQCLHRALRREKEGSREGREEREVRKVRFHTKITKDAKREKRGFLARDDLSAKKSAPDLGEKEGGEIYHFQRSR
jgi:hypothetical protein